MYERTILGRRFDMKWYEFAKRIWIFWNYLVSLDPFSIQIGGYKKVGIMAIRWNWTIFKKLKKFEYIYKVVKKVFLVPPLKEGLNFHINAFIAGLPFIYNQLKCVNVKGMHYGISPWLFIFRSNYISSKERKNNRDFGQSLFIHTLIWRREKKLNCNDIIF